MNLPPQESIEELIYDADTERPYLRGKRVLSVTDVLGLCGMYDRMPASDYHLWLGQTRHKSVELWVKGTLDLRSVHDDILPSLEAYLAFEQRSGFKPYPDGAERKVWNATLQLSTRPDVIGVFPDGAEGIVELKSGTVAKPTALQTAGQDMVLGGPRRRRFGLSIPDSGKPNVVPYTSAQDYVIFASALNVSRWKLENLGIKLN